MGSRLQNLEFKSVFTRVLLKLVNGYKLAL